MILPTAKSLCPSICLHNAKRHKGFAHPLAACSLANKVQRKTGADEYTRSTPVLSTKTTPETKFGFGRMDRNSRTGTKRVSPMTRTVHVATFFHPDYTVGVGLAGLPAHRTPALDAMRHRLAGLPLFTPLLIKN